MRWPTVLNVVLCTVILSACGTKQKVVEVNRQDIAAHQRHQVADIVLNDTFTVLQFISTDSGVQLLPVSQVQRSTRTHAATSTATTNTTSQHERTTTQKERTTVRPSLPWFMSETIYMLIVGLICITIIAYIARKT